MAPDRVGTPAYAAGRHTYVDVLRVLAIAIVVLGHWLVTGVTYAHGHFDGVDVLGVVGWGSWLTLFFQVVPLFFLVGGYVNALSWEHYRGEQSWRVWPGWVRKRMLRLLVPTSGYVAVIAVGVAICQAVGVDRAELSEVAWAVALHLWFLAAYGIVVFFAPALFAAHRRWHWAVPIVFAACAVVVDTGTIEWHWRLIGWLNYVLVWGLFHQLGFAWYDGNFAGRRRVTAVLTTAAAVALLILIWPGPYPVSMVGVPGARIQNASPPSTALLCFGLVQVGVALLAEPAANRWLAEPARCRLGPRFSRAAGWAMPVYLWHMVPVVVAAVVGYPSGLLAQPRIGSGDWWIQRIPWIGALILVLVVVMVAMGIARRPVASLATIVRLGEAGAQSPLDRTWGMTPAMVLVAGVGLAAAGLGRLAVDGFAPGGELAAASLAAVAVGLVLVKWSSVGAGIIVRSPSMRG